MEYFGVAIKCSNVVFLEALEMCTCHFGRLINDCWKIDAFCKNCRHSTSYHSHVNMQCSAYIANAE